MTTLKLHVLVYLTTLLAEGKVKPASAQLHGLQCRCSPIRKHTLHKKKRTGNALLFLFPGTTRAVPPFSSDGFCSDIDKQLQRCQKVWHCKVVHGLFHGDQSEVRMTGHQFIPFNNAIFPNLVGGSSLSAASATTLQSPKSNAKNLCSIVDEEY